jgi:orotate phosphoribosyltransferase
MQAFNQDNFDNFVLENGIIGFIKEPLKLKSGRLSHWYVNWRTVGEDVFLIDQLTDFVLAFAKSHELNPDSFYGVPEGASKLGILTQYKWAKSQSNFARGSHVLPMGRGKEKDHGDPKDKSFLAMPKGRTIVIEDVTSTGHSLIETVDKLQALGVNIVATIALTNRNELTEDNQSVEAVMQAKKIPYFAVSNALTLLPKLCAKVKPAPEIISSIKESFKQYGTQEINL